MSFTSGPFNYNRFDIYEGKAKPDYLDFDKDGDKKEPMKKALKEKGGKCPKCGKDPCECDKKEVKEGNMAGAPSIKNAKVPTKTPVKYDKKMNLMAPTIKKEDVEQVDENRFAAYGGKDTDAGAKYAKPNNSGSKKGVYTMKGKDGKPLFNKEETEQQITKEDVIAFMMHEGMTNNEVSAEAIFNHISDAYLESIEAAMMEG